MECWDHVKSKSWKEVESEQKEDKKLEVKLYYIIETEIENF